ncbi:MAG TPA: YdeI/OmpD-associated family protein [Ornithinibacter sp.]|nr:YdeI/OmpD-associated family protein [Ornithinibacter sp.]
MADEIGTPGGTPERPALFFRDAAEFGRWLAAHHDTETELWMGLHRKGHPEAGLTWQAAVREALCWGWIDSKAQGIDEHTRRQRWSPRTPGSTWSTVNINAVAELAAQGRMQPSGLAAFERRREDRSGVYAYETRELDLPAQYAALLAADPAATAFWEVATPGYRKTAVNWVMTAKQEKTRDSRMAQLVGDSAAGRLIASQRYGTAPTWVERAAAAAGAAAGGATPAGAPGASRQRAGADGIPAP